MGSASAAQAAAEELDDAPPDRHRLSEGRTRPCLRGETLGRLAPDGMHGAIANPTIIARALQDSDDRDGSLRAEATILSEG